MAFIDELTISARAGRGGDGVVRWLHLKAKEFSGPSGGNGGDGGDVYLRAVPDIGILARYSGEKEFRAGDGFPGENEGRHGKRGEDCVIEIPCGSVVQNQTTGERYELMNSGEQALVLTGGRGGAGNHVFKSSVNRSPKEAYPGVPGERATLHIELRLIADAGLIGLPNAGKTTLLNALTGASGKIGSYAFTTLDPNLGALYGLVIADIPGLIEGASAGKGLGSKFLRHIARTRLLVHCISLELEDPLGAYHTVRRELESWGEGLATKDEIIVLTKSDTRDTQEIQRISDTFISLEKEPLVVSALDDDSIKVLRDTLVQRLQGTS